MAAVAMEIATSVPEGLVAVPPPTFAPSLPFVLDVSCPVTIPTKALTGEPWPYAIAGPSTAPHESSQDFVRRRYLETLYFPEVLFPLSSLVLDLVNLDPTLVRPYLLSLTRIETKHRKTLAPIISTLLAETAVATSAPPAVPAETTGTAPIEGGEVRTGKAGKGGKAKKGEFKLAKDEIYVVKVGVEVRAKSRAVEDGTAVVAKRLSDELERREALIQVILLLVYHAVSKDTALPTKPKKKRKRGDEDTSGTGGGGSKPADDPDTALELLADRISVWQAVAELAIDGGGAADQSAAVIKEFWEVLVKHFLPKNADFCSSFHNKVFGKPIPTSLLPPPLTARKPRKPKTTHPHPSSVLAHADSSTRDRSTSTQAHHSRRLSHSSASGDPHRLVPRSQSQSQLQSLSHNHTHTSGPGRKTSRSNSITSVVAASNTEETARRSLSRERTLAPVEMRRSRSRSTEPTAASLANALKKPIQSGGIAGSGRGGLVRAPSGKDLLKSREVGLMRRSVSIAAKRDREREKEKEKDEAKGGLLGRRNVVTHFRRASDEMKPGTLIFATPSKPRHQFSFPRLEPGFQMPTPIRERDEPPSSGGGRGDSASYAADTPMADRVAETPVAPGRIAIAETPLQMGGGIEEEDEDEDGEGDGLGELMVMTDDEDEGESVRVPETPAR